MISMLSSLQRRAGLLALSSVAVAILDQWSKYWLLYSVGMVARPPLELCKYFSLVMVWNHGISFGMLSRSGQDKTAYFLIAMALIISAWIARLALKSSSPTERFAYALIIGGALGNAIDRVRFGAVADFFYVHIGALGWPAFNVADSAICIGVSLLLLRMLRDSKVAP
jgi:signal peptidase II